MIIEKINKDNNLIAVIKSDKIVIDSLQSALDLIATVNYETNANKICLSKDLIVENFFDLKTGLAGEILQKFINYKTKVAIYGDFSQYTSKALNDFIKECNRGNDIFFLDSLENSINFLIKK